MVRAVSLAGCFQPGAPLSLAAEKQLLLRHCLFDGNKYKPFGAVCQRVVSRGKGKISRVKQKETSERMSLFAVIAKHYRYRSKPQFAEKIIGRIYQPPSNLLFQYD